MAILKRCSAVWGSFIEPNGCNQSKRNLEAEECLPETRQKSAAGDGSLSDDHKRIDRRSSGNGASNWRATGAEA
jgi:hypothetical protein